MCAAASLSLNFMMDPFLIVDNISGTFNNKYQLLNFPIKIYVKSIR